MDPHIFNCPDSTLLSHANNFFPPPYVLLHLELRHLQSSATNLWNCKGLGKGMSLNVCEMFFCHPGHCTVHCCLLTRVGIKPLKKRVLSVFQPVFHTIVQTSVPNAPPKPSINEWPSCYTCSPHWMSCGKMHAQQTAAEKGLYVFQWCATYAYSGVSSMEINGIYFWVCLLKMASWKFFLDMLYVHCCRDKVPPSATCCCSFNQPPPPPV